MPDPLIIEICPADSHLNEAELWRAYTALCGTIPPGCVPPPDVAPALNMLLSCLRAVGATCGPDYPDPGKESRP